MDRANLTGSLIYTHIARHVNKLQYRFFILVKNSRPDIIVKDNERLDKHNRRFKKTRCPGRR